MSSPKNKFKLLAVATVGSILLTGCAVLTNESTHTYIKFVDGIDYQTVAYCQLEAFTNNLIGEVQPTQVEHELYPWYSGLFWTDDTVFDKDDINNIKRYINKHKPDQIVQRKVITSPHTASMENQRIYYVFLRYREHLKPYVIDYHLDGGHFEYKTVYRTYCLRDIDYEFDNIKSKIPNPIKVGYTFSGWYDENDVPLAYMTIEGDFSIYAKWLPNGGF